MLDYRWMKISKKYGQEIGVYTDIPFYGISSNYIERSQTDLKSIPEINTAVIASYYRPDIKKDINLETHINLKKFGKIKRKYDSGDMIYCKDNNKYFTVNGYDEETGFYSV